jgi:hypothetical protein
LRERIISGEYGEASLNDDADELHIDADVRLRGGGRIVQDLVKKTSKSGLFATLLTRFCGGLVLHDLGC